MSNLEVRSLNLSVPGKLLCGDLSFSMGQGEWWGLLGRNGAGKTTLLHSLAGIRGFDSGEILLGGKQIRKYPRAELARKIGILFQDGLETLPATVLETVMLGRHPHAQSLFRDSPEDLAAGEAALADFALGELRERKLASLSGGEKQRVAIAMLLAQAPGIFLLDEPGNHLDLAFQTGILKVLKSRTAGKPASLLMATHDINLAARFCSRFLLLFEEGEYLCGGRDEVLDPANLSRAYGCDIRLLAGEGQALFYPA